MSHVLFSTVVFVRALNADKSEQGLTQYLDQDLVL